MSLVLTLVSMACLLTVTTSETVLSILDKVENKRIADPIPTRYRDTDILLQTLTEHGANVRCSEDGTIVAECFQGKLIYTPDGENGSYTVRVDDTTDINELCEDFKCLDSEYDANVQSYTYNHVIENLPDNMKIEEEQVLEDNSILITIGVC